MTNTDDVPVSIFLYEAVVEIGDRIDHGAGPAGHRYLIPILGGTFAGARLNGRVLGGGADRQLHRPDGIKELDALYEMQTDDGAIITVRNRVVIDESVTPQRYARSVVTFAAPDAYAWLSRRMFVGTLASLRPARAAVRIRVYQLD